MFKKPWGPPLSVAPPLTPGAYSESIVITPRYTYDPFSRRG
ncbi:hypothetical protein ACIBO2_28030 [Nonomuraea sp. NPDC050022]